MLSLAGEASAQHCAARSLRSKASLRRRRLRWPKAVEHACGRQAGVEHRSQTVCRRKRSGSESKGCEQARVSSASNAIYRVVRCGHALRQIAHLRQILQARPLACGCSLWASSMPAGRSADCLSRWYYCTPATRCLRACALLRTTSARQTVCSRSKVDVLVEPLVAGATQDNS